MKKERRKALWEAIGRAMEEEEKRLKDSMLKEEREKCWGIRVGSVGPTDANWVLSHPDGRSKEACIESKTWKCLSSLDGYVEGAESIGIKDDLSQICQLIWDSPAEDWQ